MSSENLCLATLSNTYDFLLFFNVLFPLFLFQNGRGAVIVCIIYTTGYKTPLCHSPESTYRCGCTVYQHMYCSKISFACMAPSWPLETGGKSLLRAHEKRVKQRPPGSRRLPWTSPSFESQSFRRRLASVHISAPQQSAISLCWPPLTPQRVLWLMLLLLSDSNSCSCIVFFIIIFIFNLAQIIDTVTDPYINLTVWRLCSHVNASYCCCVENISVTQTQAMQMTTQSHLCSVSVFARCACLPLFARNKGGQREVDYKGPSRGGASHRWVNAVWLTC